jgi:hypothetical protein
MLLVLGIAAQRVQAQSLEAGALAFNAQHRVLYQGTVTERSALFVGGRGAVRLGPVAVRVAGLFGSLGASADSATPETSVRTTSLAVMLRTAAWLELGGEVEARRFEADAGTTAWRLIGGTVRATPAMGMSGLSGLVELSFFASASEVVSKEKLSPALRGTFGVSYATPGGVELRLGYRFERFDYSGNTTNPRLEQFRGIVAGVGIRLGR